METKRYLLIESSAERVWRALTTAAGLTEWLCEKATIDLVVGGGLRLTSAIPLATGDHQITMIEPERALGIAWDIAGVKTRALVKLSDHGGLTRVVVTHVIPDEATPALDAARDSMQTELGTLNMMWAYALLLLRSHFEKGAAEARVRSDEDPRTVDLTIGIDASPSQVFKALTTPSEVKGWNSYAKDVRIDPRVGGRYSFGWESEEKGTDGPGEIVEYKDGHKVVYTWHGVTKTLVSWTVTPIEDAHEKGQTRTRLHLQHSGFVIDPSVVMEYKLGWADFLFTLATYVGGKPGLSSVSGCGEGPA